MSFLAEVSQNTSADTPQWLVWGMVAFAVVVAIAIVYDRKNK